MKRIPCLLLLVAVVVILALTSCSAEPREIVVGSKIDTEGSLLAAVMIVMLRDGGFDVEDKSGTGPTQLVRQAITSGEIDIYPEYTGNGAFFFSETDSPVWHDAQQGYERVRELDKEANDIEWLHPAPANNTWAIAIPKSLADQHDIRTLADFADYVNEGAHIRFAGSQEFLTSPVALPAIMEAYGFTLRENQLLTFASGNTAQTEQAAAAGTDGVNAAMAYGTDGGISALNLVVLEDPKGVQPFYRPAPIVRGEILRKYPEIGDILNPVFEALDIETLQTLNARIALQGQDAHDVAEEYLKANGFLD
jgi:osmoprotectant transport system substrate-binding protein